MAEYFSEIIKLLFPFGIENRTMAVLAAYFDDSGTHVGAGYAVVAGGVSSVQQWVKLSRAWKRTTTPWKLKKGYFRMADFVNGIDDYRGWSPEVKAARLNRLVDIIRGNVRKLIGNAVKEAAFNEAFAKCPTARIGTAYRFCAFLILPAVDKWRKRSPERKPVAFVFESGNKLMNEYGQVFAQLGSDERLREKFGVASITEGQKRDMPALQAADVIAYATYKCLVEKQITPMYLKHAFERLFAMRRNGLIYSDPDFIEQGLRNIDALS